MIRITLILAMFLGLGTSAFADTSNFQRTPNPLSVCVTGIRTYPAIGSTVSGVSNCYMEADDVLDLPYWNLSDDWTATSSLEISLLSGSASSTVIIGDKYLVTLMSTTYNSDFGYIICPRYIKNVNGVRVGTNYQYLHNSATDYHMNAFPYTGTPSSTTINMASWCAYEMNDTVTSSSQFDFEIGVSTTSAEWSPSGASLGYGNVSRKMYAIFATSSVAFLDYPVAYPLDSFANTKTFIESLSSYSGSTGAVGSATYLTCSSLDIFCHMGNAFQYVFYPSDESLDRFATISLASSSPFSYIYDMGVIRNELFATTSTSTISIVLPFAYAGSASSTITLLNAQMLSDVPYASWIRTILMYLLWILLAELIYYKVLRSHDVVTP